jgi:hypothetical protein
MVRGDVDGGSGPGRQGAGAVVGVGRGRSGECGEGGWLVVRLSGGGVLGWMCVVEGRCGHGVGGWLWAMPEEESDVGEAGCLSEVR